MKVTCLHPQTIKNPFTKEWIQVPCGRCEACLCNRASNWVSRLEQESKFSNFVVFFTLTYSDEFLPIVPFSSLDSDEMEIVSNDYKSQNLILYYHGVPTAKVKDIQDFLKRFRQSIFRCKSISEAQKYVRYYIVSEFGPTGLRPHYHGILFIENEFLFDNVEDFIFKAWSSFDKHTSKRTPLGRIDVQGVERSASQYVASYLNSISDLPKILQSKAFRPFSLFSRRPPIGSHSFSRASLQSILDGKTCCFTITKPETFETVSVPLWRTFENTWFPKCLGFNSLSNRGRFALYGLSSLFSTFVEFKWYVISKWPDIRCSVGDSLDGVLNKVFRLCEDYRDDTLDVVSDFPKKLQDSMLRMYRLSCRVRLIRSRVNKSLFDYVQCIDRYYKNKDYQCLKAQLAFEQNIIEQNGSNHDVFRVLLTLIDPLFYENKRSLSFEVRQNYLSQFDVSLETLDNNLFPHSRLYRDMVYRYYQYVKNGKDKKLRNEYLEKHPELLILHL